MDIFKMTALELGRAIKEGKITSPEIIDAVYRAIEDKDMSINAYITVNRDEALARSVEIQKKIENGELSSPLAGIPIAVKDNICTKNIKTTCASKMLENFSPVYNATVIERLEAAGMIVFGKTNMDEFAMGSTTETSYFDSTKNPHNTDFVSGGSSGGSAAAVAAKEAVIALGSDTGGSIRQPAAFCGVTGFKPTYGTVSRYGLIAYASSLDQIGPIGRDVTDCAAICDIISGIDPLDSTTLSTEGGLLEGLNGNINGMKIAIPRQFFSEGLDGEIKSAILRTAEKTEQLGAELHFVDLPILDYLISTYYIIASAEAASNLSRYDGVKYGFCAEGAESLSDLYVKSRTEAFGKEVKKRILLGNFVLSSGYYDEYYLKALKVKTLINRELDKLFCEHDAVLAPVAPTVAPKIDEGLENPLKMYISDAYNVLANLGGLPALSVPCGKHSNGLPIGMQIMGKAMDDGKVLNIGYAFQNATDYHKTFSEVIK